jgi:hypothetical protein
LTVSFSENEKHRLKSYTTFFQTFILQLVLLSLFLLVLLVGRDYFLSHFLSYFEAATFAPSFWLWFALLNLGLLLQILLLQGLAFWAAERNFARHGLFSAAANVLALIVVAIFVFFLKIKITFILVVWSVGNGFLGVVVCFLIVKKINLQKLKFCFSNILKKNSQYSDLFKYALSALSVVLADKMVAFVIRDWAIETFEPLAVGQWQTLLKLSDHYGAVFSATFLVVFFPKIAQHLQQEEKVVSFFFKKYTFLLGIISAGLLLVYFQYQNIVVLLFEKSLIAPTSWLGYWLWGDFFRLQNYTLSQFFLARKWVSTYSLLQFVFGLFFIILLQIGLFFQLQNDGILLLLQARLGSYAFSVLVLGAGVFYKK